MRQNECTSGVMLAWAVSQRESAVEAALAYAEEYLLALARTEVQSCQSGKRPWYVWLDVETTELLMRLFGLARPDDLCRQAQSALNRAWRDFKPKNATGVVFPHFITHANIATSTEDPAQGPAIVFPAQTNHFK